MTDNITTIVRFSLSFIVVAITIVLMIYGRDILIPLALSILGWLLLNAMSDRLHQFSVGGLRLPKWLCLAISLLSVVLAILVTVQLVADTVSSMTTKAPQYEANLKAALARFSERLDLVEVPTLSDLYKKIDLTNWISAILRGLSGLAGNIGVIVIYVAFLFVEQRSLPAKMEVIFTDPERRQRVLRVLDRMSDRIRKYLVVKTAMALLSSVIAYVVMVAVGLDFAAFWALFTFLTYYVPTIGSLLALIFPLAFALVQFESVVPALIILVVSGGLQTVVGNVIEPRYLSKSLNVSAFVIILSLFTWGAIWGVAGMFLCVPMTVILMIVLAHFERTRPIAVALSSDGQIAQDA